MGNLNESHSRLSLNSRKIRCGYSKLNLSQPNIPYSHNRVEVDNTNINNLGIKKTKQSSLAKEII